MGSVDALSRDGRGNLGGILCTAMIVTAVAFSWIWTWDAERSIPFLAGTAFAGIAASKPGFVKVSFFEFNNNSTTLLKFNKTG